MTFTQEFTIGLDDVDINGQIKDKSILRFLENTACFHADSVGDGLNEINEKGRAWALLEWEVKILKRPSYGGKIKVETWGRKYTKVFVFRDFIIYENDQPAIYATSKWFSLDLKRRMPARIFEEMMTCYGPEDRAILGNDNIEKLNEQEHYDTINQLSVRRSDIDMLGHFHNTCYLDMIHEIMPKEEDQNFNNIKISYLKEIPCGEKVSLLTHRDNNKLYVAFKTNDCQQLNALAELY